MYTQEEINILEVLYTNFTVHAFDYWQSNRLTQKEFCRNASFFSEVESLALAFSEKGWLDSILEHDAATTPYEDLPLFINNESALADMIVTWRLDIGK